MKNKFKIGEVSKLLGISPDTIRLYEKKNIITPIKNPETKYRYYSIHDIYILLDTIFYKRINISLDDISDLMWNSSYEDMKKIINKKEMDIINEIKKQRMYLKKLNRTKKSFNLIENHLNKLSILPFEKIFILSELDADPYKNLLNLDIENIDLYNLSSIMYFKNNAIDTKYCLTIEETDIKDFNLENVLNPKKYLQYDRCIYTVMKVDYDSINISHFKDIFGYISKNNIKSENYFIINYIFSALEDKSHIDYIEIFLPIL